jgi:ABC-type xylose transport system permease subunit
MARKRSSMVPAWLRHRQILTTEAVLLVGVGVELLQRWTTSRPDVPWWIKTLAVMLVNAGMLGGVLLLFIAWTRGSLHGATRAVRAVPLPAPLVFAHLLVGIALFALYAWVWGFWPSSPVG